MTRLSRQFLLAAAAATVGCVVFRLQPTLPLQNAGCYSVAAANWTAAHSRVTGFEKLPDAIRIDAVDGGRILVPTEWLDADRSGENRAALGLYSFAGRVDGDTLVRVAPSRNPPPLPPDSMIVAFRGWHGGVQALLARDGDGFTGLGFLSPRQDAQGLSSVKVSLRPGPCPVVMAQANWADIKWLEAVTGPHIGRPPY